MKLFSLLSIYFSLTLLSPYVYDKIKEGQKQSERYSEYAESIKYEYLSPSWLPRREHLAPGPFGDKIFSFLENRTVFYQSAEWSPDNKTICFAAIVLDSGKFVRGKWEIYSMKTDGSELKRLTNNSWDDLWPSFSPDGKKIVFQSERDGNEEIYIMNANGGNPVRITNDTARDGSPAWSPDGKKILFSSDHGGNYEVYQMNIDGSNPAIITSPPGKKFNPAWSPDGKRITYYNERGDRKDQVYVSELSGNAMNVTHDTLNNIYPSWSPDGSKIIFGSRGIYTINADGSGNKIGITKGFFARYSHDGKQIICIDGGWPNSEIYLCNVDGSGRKQISDKESILKIFSAGQGVVK